MTITRLWLGLSLIAALLLAWNMAAHAKCRSVYDTSRSCDPSEFLAPSFASPAWYRAPAERQSMLIACLQNYPPPPAAWCRAAYQAGAPRR